MKRDKHPVNTSKGRTVNKKQIRIGVIVGLIVGALLAWLIGSSPAEEPVVYGPPPIEDMDDWPLE